MNEQHELEQLIDQMISQLKVEMNDEEDKKQIGLWIPETKKQKFDRIQKATKNKFGKFIQGIIIKAVDRVDIEDLEAAG